MKLAFIYTYDPAPKKQPWLPPYMRRKQRSTLGQQQASCQQVARQNGMRVVGQYGGSYESFNRPHRFQMIRELKRSPGRVEAVIVSSPKNLETDLRTFLRLLDEIEATGAELLTATLPLNLHPEIRKRLQK